MQGQHDAVLSISDSRSLVPSPFYGELLPHLRNPIAARGYLTSPHLASPTYSFTPLYPPNMFRTTKSAESTTSTKASRRGTLPFGFNIKTSFFQSPSSSQTTLVSVGQAGQQDKSAEQSPQHLAVHEAHPHGGAAGPSQEHVQQHAQSQSHSGRRHSREAREGGSQQASRQSTPLPLIPQPLLPVQTAQQPPQMAHQPTLGKRPSCAC